MKKGRNAPHIMSLSHFESSVSYGACFGKRRKNRALQNNGPYGRFSRFSFPEKWSSLFILLKIRLCFTCYGRFICRKRTFALAGVNGDCPLYLFTGVHSFRR